MLTVKGGTQEPNIRKAVPNVDVVTFETTQQAFLALQQGKGVGYVNDEASIVNDYAKLGPAKKDYTILPTSISVEPLALGNLLRCVERRQHHLVGDRQRVGELVLEDVAAAGGRARLEGGDQLARTEASLERQDGRGPAKSPRMPSSSPSHRLPPPAASSSLEGGC